MLHVYVLMHHIILVLVLLYEWTVNVERRLEADRTALFTVRARGGEPVREGARGCGRHVETHRERLLQQIILCILLLLTYVISNRPTSI